MGKDMHKQYIEVPLPMSYGFLYKLWTRLKGILLSPIYLVMAHIAGAPGIGFHLRYVATGIRLLLTGRPSLKACFSHYLLPGETHSNTLVHDSTSGTVYQR